MNITSPGWESSRGVSMSKISQKRQEVACLWRFFHPDGLSKDKVQKGAAIRISPQKTVYQIVAGIILKEYLQVLKKGVCMRRGQLHLTR